MSHFSLQIIIIFLRDVSQEISNRLFSHIVYINIVQNTLVRFATSIQVSYLFSIEIKLVLRDCTLPDTFCQRLSFAKPDVDVDTARIE